MKNTIKLLLMISMISLAACGGGSSSNDSGVYSPGTTCTNGSSMVTAEAGTFNTIVGQTGDLTVYCGYLNKPCNSVSVAFNSSRSGNVVVKIYDPDNTNPQTNGVNATVTTKAEAAANLVTLNMNGQCSHTFKATIVSKVGPYRDAVFDIFSDYTAGTGNLKSGAFETDNIYTNNHGVQQ